MQTMMMDPLTLTSSTYTKDPHNNDVLCGRGGTINAHPGNEQYRKFVERKKRLYLTARFKREKREIAASIVEEIRNLDPPGRFLTKDRHSDTWYDVGDEKARDKTSQALREGSQLIRKKMEEEYLENRKKQAREVAIAAGRDPDEAVQNMLKTEEEISKKREEEKKTQQQQVKAPPQAQKKLGGDGMLAAPPQLQQWVYPGPGSAHMATGGPPLFFPPPRTAHGLQQQPQATQQQLQAMMQQPPAPLAFPSNPQQQQLLLQQSLNQINQQITINQQIVIPPPVAPTTTAAAPPVDRHVQFQLQNDQQHPEDIPLIISSNNPPTNPDDGTSPLRQSPDVEAMSQSQAETHATPLTFLSADMNMSVKTSDSLNHYLMGIEDEISGDVGQEVELVAHAPTEHHSELRQQHQRPPHHRSTPPRHRKSNGGSRHSSSRRRKRRSGSHIPSNSGKVQLDLSAVPGATAAATDTAGAAQMGVGGGVCGDNAAAVASCGVIMPTPLRSSTGNSLNRSPPASGTQLQHLGNTMSPMSPSIHSLDLDKMSLCGTENVSQAGGSIGGASLCRVFDEHDDSVIGAGALMDMTMSLGSHPSSGPSDGSRGSGAACLGLQPIPVHPQSVFDGVQTTDKENASLLAGCEALMDMSVGSGVTHHSTTWSKNGTGAAGSQHSGSASGSKSSSGPRSSVGRSDSPASFDKASVEGGVKMDLQEQQQLRQEVGEHPAPAPLGAGGNTQEFRFTWDGKREE